MAGVERVAASRFVDHSIATPWEKLVLDVENAIKHAANTNNSSHDVDTVVRAAHLAVDLHVAHSCSAASPVRCAAARRAILSCFGHTGPFVLVSRLESSWLDVTATIKHTVFSAVVVALQNVVAQGRNCRDSTSSSKFLPLFVTFLGEEGLQEAPRTADFCGYRISPSSISSSSSVTTYSSRHQTAATFLHLDDTRGLAADAVDSAWSGDGTARSAAMTVQVTDSYRITAVATASNAFVTGGAGAAEASRLTSGHPALPINVTLSLDVAYPAARSDTVVDNADRTSLVPSRMPPEAWSVRATCARARDERGAGPAHPADAPALLRKDLDHDAHAHAHAHHGGCLVLPIAACLRRLLAAYVRGKCCAPGVALADLHAPGAGTPGAPPLYLAAANPTQVAAAAAALSPPTRAALDSAAGATDVCRLLCAADRAAATHGPPEAQDHRRRRLNTFLAAVDAQFDLLLGPVDPLTPGGDGGGSREAGRVPSPFRRKPKAQSGGADAAGRDKTPHGETLKHVAAALAHDAQQHHADAGGPGAVDLHAVLALVFGGFSGLAGPAGLASQSYVWGEWVRCLRRRWEAGRTLPLVYTHHHHRGGGGGRHEAEEDMEPGPLWARPLWRDVAGRAVPVDPTLPLLSQKLQMLHLCALAQAAGRTVAHRAPGPAPPVELQRRRPVTEDDLAQRTYLLAKLAEEETMAESDDDEEEARRLRRLQVGWETPASDMRAFKAARPAADFGDFLAWYTSPGGSPAAVAEQDREEWALLWAVGTPPCPAAEQRPLMHAEMEAEKALDYLRQLSPAQVASEVLVGAVAAAPALVAARARTAAAEVAAAAVACGLVVPAKAALHAHAVRRLAALDTEEDAVRAEALRLARLLRADTPMYGAAAGTATATEALNQPLLLAVDAWCGHVARVEALCQRLEAVGEVLHAVVCRRYVCDWRTTHGGCDGEAALALAAVAVGVAAGVAFTPRTAAECAVCFQLAEAVGAAAGAPRVPAPPPLPGGLLLAVPAAAARARSAPGKRGGRELGLPCERVATYQAGDGDGEEEGWARQVRVAVATGDFSVVVAVVAMDREEYGGT